MAGAAAVVAVGGEGSRRRGSLLGQLHASARADDDRDRDGGDSSSGSSILSRLLGTTHPGDKDKDADREKDRDRGSLRDRDRDRDRDPDRDSDPDQDAMREREKQYDELWERYKNRGKTDPKAPVWSNHPDLMATADHVPRRPKTVIVKATTALLPNRASYYTTDQTHEMYQAQQSFRPIRKIHTHLCGFHFYSDDMARQVVVHHYCNHLNQDVQQCILYDSDEANARIIGVEYNISAELFRRLPADEKKYWHSHVYEVKGGTIFLPGALPECIHKHAEMMAMRELVNTYGKSVHLWQFDKEDVLPLGPPQLGMAFTEDGQLDPIFEKRMQGRYGVDRQMLIEERRELDAEPTELGCD